MTSAILDGNTTQTPRCGARVCSVASRRHGPSSAGDGSEWDQLCRRQQLWPASAALGGFDVRERRDCQPAGQWRNEARGQMCLLVGAAPDAISRDGGGRGSCRQSDQADGVPSQAPQLRNHIPDKVAGKSYAGEDARCWIQRFVIFSVAPQTECQEAGEYGRPNDKCARRRGDGPRCLPGLLRLRSTRSSNRRKLGRERYQDGKREIDKPRASDFTVPDIAASS